MGIGIDFPNSPTNGQTLIANGITYKYDSSVGAWLIDSYTANSALPNTSGVSFNGNLTIAGLLTLTSNLNFDSTLSTKIVDPAANVLTIHTTQTERMRFDSTGNVLINRTDSTVGSGVRFDVNGSANVASMSVTNALGVGTAPSTTTGEIRATNNITAYFSDKRLKTNIKTIKNSLDKINKISGVTFTSNEEAAKYGYVDSKTQVGVLAQEIESVLPEVVVPAPFDIGIDENGNEYSKSGQNYKTVHYEKLIPLLIEALKELSDHVNDLKNQLQEFKK